MREKDGGSEGWEEIEGWGGGWQRDRVSSAVGYCSSVLIADGDPSLILQKPPPYAKSLLISHPNPSITAPLSFPASLTASPSPPAPPPSAPSPPPD